MVVKISRGNGHEVINKCIDNERQALLRFRASVEDRYDHLSTWIREDDECCKWSGVMCNNETGHVTKLDLYMFCSGGYMSPSLLNLTYLDYLDLSYNCFGGTIPTFIGFMTRLRYLNLAANSFTGVIPKSIGFLTELRYLNLWQNRLEGTIPKFIGSLSQLRYLNLRWNSFHGIIIPEFGNLTNLQELIIGYLGRCTVENLDWLPRLSHLQYLQMSGISLAKQNHWVNTILQLQNLLALSLADCDLSHVMYPYSSSFLNSSSPSSISMLNLEENNLNSSMYSWFFSLTSNRLDALYLSSNKLDGKPNYFGNLCSLTTLEVINNSVVVKFHDFMNNLFGGCTIVPLQSLDVSSSQFTGPLSDEIQKFSSLTSLDLSYNHLSGTMSDKVWELPKLETLDVSSNYLSVVMSQNLAKSKLSYINLSNTSLDGVHCKARMTSNLSYVENVDLTSCKLGPGFPKWIQMLKYIKSLDLSNNRISDTIPEEFWNSWPSRLVYLNLSYNNLSGEVPDLLSNFDLDHSVIDLSSNNFSGPMMNVTSTLVSLNLSRNKFNGGVSFLCQIVNALLTILDLSHNSFTGQLPNCLWHFNKLKVLNLEYNMLEGRLPTSLGYLVGLEAMYLHNNDFSGELPSSLKNCTNIQFLNLGANNFNGNIPVWIGESLSRLYAISLRSNNFVGAIPLQLCQLGYLQILDLSMNNLHGTIPTCLNNLTLMVQEGSPLVWTEHYFYWSESHGTYLDHAVIEWSGIEREFTSNLVLLKSIDLSSNNLTSQIPNELTHLHEVLALNLSKNVLLGEIPQNIGNLNNLLTLDLSRNNISGGLPSSMSEMTSLNYLDVSYNNLSGRIPTSTQLQSFDPSRYIGNIRLCGPPITKYCPEDKESELPPILDGNEGDKEGTNELQRWFYIGLASGFGVGFLISCSFLLFNFHGRHMLFLFLDNSKDWIYVKVMVFISKCKRFANTP